PWLARNPAKPTRTCPVGHASLYGTPPDRFPYCAVGWLPERAIPVATAPPPAPVDALEEGPAPPAPELEEEEGVTALELELDDEDAALLDSEELDVLALDDAELELAEEEAAALDEELASEELACEPELEETSPVAELEAAGAPPAPPALELVDTE